MSIDDRFNAGNGESPRQSGVIPPTVKDDMRSAAEIAKSNLSSLKSEAGHQVEELTGEAKRQVSQVAERARTFASQQKDYAAGQMDGIAMALSRVADDMSTGDQAMVGNYARQIADGMQRFSSNIRTKSVDELIGMAQDFGRRQPVAFIGAAALAGLIASRFIMASARRRSEEQYGDMDDDGYGGGMGTGSMGSGAMGTGSMGSSGMGASGMGAGAGLGGTSSFGGTSSGLGGSGTSGLGTSGGSTYSSGTGGLSSSGTGDDYSDDEAGTSGTGGTGYGRGERTDG